MRNTSLSLLAALALAACSGGAGTNTAGTTGTGTGGGSSSSSSTGTGGSQPMGAKIDAPDSKWTWVPFTDAFCADGSTTGIGVNLTSKSSRVIVYFEGGGACWDELTCYTLNLASHITGGYGATQFTAETGDATHLALPGGFFDRSASANPFKDYSYVYVPYCTGDIHAGNNVATSGTHTTKHVGFANVSAYLKRLVPTFAKAERIYVAGSSAGGFGAAYNWWQTQQAFGKIRVDLIDDSGTPMPADIPVQYEATQRKAWNLASTLPPDCTGCDKGLDALFSFYEKTFPTQRAALLSYTQDSVLPTYYQITDAAFGMGLNEDLATYFTPTSNFRSFVVNQSGHVLWFNGSPSTAAQFSQLQQFLTKMVTDDQTWASVGP